MFVVRLIDALAGVRDGASPLAEFVPADACISDRAARGSLLARSSGMAASPTIAPARRDGGPLCFADFGTTTLSNRASWGWC